MTITGYEAIELAERLNLKLNKYADPTEESREGLTVEEAREIAAEDPSLIWIDEKVETYRETNKKIDELIDGLSERSREIFMSECAARANEAAKTAAADKYFSAESVRDVKDSTKKATNAESAAEAAYFAAKAAAASGSASVKLENKASAYSDAWYAEREWQIQRLRDLREAE